MGGTDPVLIEQDIDELYQLPLAEFTSTRDALAKRAGARRAEIKALEKPNAAAWGVNQLYWRRRKTLDRLVTAFERVRAAQANLLSGRPADLAHAEVAHRVALDHAVEDVRTLLVAAGDPASPMTMAAVAQTLHTLPSTPMNGRLTRPLEPVGFGALAGLMGAAAARPSRTADVVSIEKGRRVPPVENKEDSKKQRAAEARRAEVVRVEMDLQTARATERAAEAKAAQAEAAAGRAKEDRDRARAELDAAEERARDRQAAASRASAEARDATTARKRLEAQLERLSSKS